MACPLTQRKTGDFLIVERIVGSQPNVVKKLAAFGVEPGVPIRLLQKCMAYVIAVGYTEIALDRQTAMQILVSEAV